MLQIMIKTTTFGELYRNITDDELIYCAAYRNNESSIFYWSFHHWKITAVTHA